MNVCLNIFMAMDFLDCEDMQMMKVLGVTHRKDCRIESDVVAPVKVI